MDSEEKNNLIKRNKKHQIRKLPLLKIQCNNLTREIIIWKDNSHHNITEWVYGFTKENKVKMRTFHLSITKEYNISSQLTIINNHNKKCKVKKVSLRTLKQKQKKVCFKSLR
jgi:hypothetical protein